MLLPFLFLSVSAFAVEPTVINLWPTGAPGQIKTIPEPATPNPTSLTNITDPTLTVYRPEKPNGTAIIVAPGGGFSHLAIAHEGTQVCEWLNSIGVTAALLTYRTPTNQESIPYEKPVQDAQRAIGILRHHAAEWGIGRIGLLGFSAGGSLAVHTALEEAGMEPGGSELSMVPTTTVEVGSESEAKKVLRLIEALDDHDDVQNVYANFDIPDAVMAAYEG